MLVFMSVSASEELSERHDDAQSFGRMGHLDAHGRRIWRVKPHTDSVCLAKVLQIDVRPSCSDLSCVEEERHIDELPSHPPVLAGDQETMSISKTPGWIASQLARAAKIGHQKVGNGMSRVDIGSRHQRSQCDHPVLPKKGNEMIG